LGEVGPDKKGRGDWQLTIDPAGCPVRGAVRSRTTSRQLRNVLSKQT
jgi:hypothetical protein